MDQPVGGIAGWVIEIVYTLGYVGLLLLIVLETVFPPVPSELILPLAGFLTGQGRLSYPLAVASSTLGSVIGALAFYWMGSALGPRRIRSLVERYGKWGLVEPEDVDK